MNRFSPMMTGWWLAGLLIGATGVGLARGLAPVVPPAHRAAVEAAGRVLGFAGLVVIAAGIGRRGRAAGSGADSFHPTETPPP